MANTIGYDNTAQGFGTLSQNTATSKNTAVGTSALYTQSYNPGYAMMTNNTAIGHSALYSNNPTSNTNGDKNTAVGVDALRTNGTGFNNTAVGYQALYSNSTGVDNTAIGKDALRSSTGDFNTVIGYTALGQHNSGHRNTVIGAFSTSTAATGDAITAVGYNTGVLTDDLINATAIGYNAKVGQSNSLVLGGTGGDAVKVGIGTSTPTETLDVRGNANVTGSIRMSNTDIYLREGSDTNHGIGWYGSGKEFASTNIDGPALYGWSGGALGTTNGGQKILMRWDTDSLEFDGYAGFHVLSGGATSICRDGNNSLSSCTSDVRLKKDIISLPETRDVFEALSRLRGVTFAWDRSNPKAANMLEGRDLGMIAQEVEEVFPEVVHTDTDGYKSLDYHKLVAFLVEVNKAQQVELDTMRKRNREETGRLSSQVKDMQKELEELKRLVYQQR
jgi:hypothetical protein